MINYRIFKSPMTPFAKGAGRRAGGFFSGRRGKSRGHAFTRHDLSRTKSARPRQSLRLAALLVLLALFSAGCSPLYVMRAAVEQGKILWRREPIVSYIQNPELDAETREKLALVLAVRDYARDVLHMNVGASYATFSYVDRPILSFIVTGAPKTELKPYTWWFPVVGRVPYKGYFSTADATAAAEGLEKRGFDSYIRPSAAFSTLGWFDDPLLAHLLKYDRRTLAEIIFHELFHNTLFIKGAGSFNESVANFVGHRGAIDFFRDRFGEASAEYESAVQAWQDELEFSRFMQELADSLRSLYESDIAEEEKLRIRQKVFTRAKAEWDKRIADRPAHRLRNFSRRPLNNAVIIHYLLYLSNLQLFESLYEAERRDLAETIRSIRAAVERGGDPFEAVEIRLAERLQDQSRVSGRISSEFLVLSF